MNFKRASGGTRSPGLATKPALDSELIAEARVLTGIQQKSALIREALRALIERESSRRLARLGGSEPQLSRIPRRRSHPVPHTIE